MCEVYATQEEINSNYLLNLLVLLTYLKDLENQEKDWPENCVVTRYLE